MVHSRPAQIFLGKNAQTPQGTLGQKSICQPLGLQYKSFTMDIQIHKKIASTRLFAQIALCSWGDHPQKILPAY